MGARGADQYGDLEGELRVRKVKYFKKHPKKAEAE
jgi:hypothetical protein